jgi:hypothetical protein
MCIAAAAAKFAFSTALLTLRAFHDCVILALPSRAHRTTSAQHCFGAHSFFVSPPPSHHHHYRHRANAACYAYKLQFTEYYKHTV